jgi:cell division protein ZapD
MAIKQRAAIPGGVCEFDLPAYHHWLNKSSAERRQDLAGWIEPFAPIRTGSAIVLRLLRENSRVSRHTATRGVFQLMLTTAKVAQLLRLRLEHNPPYVPEISANKYALNIRFIGVSGMDRGNVVDQDVDFELAFCNL